MVTVLDSGMSGSDLGIACMLWPWARPFTSVHPGILMSTGELNTVGNHTVDWHPIEVLHARYVARQEQ